ncbi:hypothetical protein VaNZ11_005503 [Volvox africanus]|uniref:Uncharacterized protein n=1 Tax=Volvox africanus TaxID=51714 RepID=A0ABQ5RYR9_9CHLO|nr:hypothetical protein VaNZ11_005503 [Volvox africanus]
MAKPNDNEPKGDGLQSEELRLVTLRPPWTGHGTSGRRKPMAENVALVQRVLAYSKMEDKAIGDHLIFQVAPEVYQHQGLKSVYDRLRCQANPCHHQLGGEYWALAFKAFEHLHAVYHRLEEAQMLASGSGKE